MPTQAELRQRLRQAREPAARRDCALDLLDATRSRDHVDAALRALADEDVSATLTTDHRPILRAKAAYYFENADRDRGGLAREQIVRLLIGIGHPDDIDIYLDGVATYHRQPKIDSAQNLRAAALVGLANADQTLGCAYAVRLLGEPDTSQLNGEPSFAAVNVLAQVGQLLPVYAFALHRGRDFIARANPEVVARALDALAHRDFPRRLYRELAERYLALDAPVITSGIIDGIIDHRAEELYGLIECIIADTRHNDLLRYALFALAAARDEPLIRMLYRLARACDDAHAADYLEAVALTTGEARDAVTAALERKLPKRD